VKRSYQLVVRALIKRGGRCLLLRRSSACRAFVGQWEWPGGKVDPGEPFDRALRREVLEETGLRIEPAGVVGAFHLKTRKMVVLCMEARLISGRIRVSTEHDARRWVPIADAMEWDLIYGLKEMLGLYAGRRGSRGRRKTQGRQHVSSRSIVQRRLPHG